MLIFVIYPSYKLAVPIHIINMNTKQLSYFKYVFYMDSGKRDKDNKSNSLMIILK